MANITIPKRIRQAFINSLFKYDKDSRTNLDWNWNLKKKGRKVCDYIFIDKTFPVDSVHPVNEEGEQFAPFITVKECIPVSWDNGAKAFVSKGRCELHYSLSCTGYKSIEDLMNDYSFEKTLHISGYFLRVHESIEYEPSVPNREIRTNGGTMSFKKLVERYKIMAMFENGYKGEIMPLLEQQCDALNTIGLSKVNGQPYNTANIRAMRRSKPYLRLITDPPNFSIYQTNHQRCKMHYYPHVTEIYETMRIMSDQPPRKIAAKLTKKGIQYKKEEDFTSAVIDTFRGHVAYKRYLKQFGN